MAIPRCLAFPCALAVISAACATGEPPMSDSLGGDATGTNTAVETSTDPSTTTTTGTTTDTTTTTDATDTDVSTDTDTDTGTGTDTDTDGEEPINYDAPKQRIYQLTVRLFSNTKTINVGDGDIDTNGVGKFAEIDEVALAELRAMGYSHIWLHGVLQQASATAYPEIMEEADDPDTVKGKAGSYYAISDYYDVSADYAIDPASRLDEFKELVDRIHAAEMKVLIDLVPNHVARTYHTDIPFKTDFGLSDTTGVFTAPNNNFFYLSDPPGQVLTLPTPDWWTPPGMPDGTYADEDNDDDPKGDVPRATGNNVTSIMPAVTDWYDTVKLNYGYDFTMMSGVYDPMPKTWLDMDKIIDYWQKDIGVDGFRVDFAHYIPLEFWQWEVAQARGRDPDVYFVAEAYDSDPNGIPGFTFPALLDTGFDAVYDDELYDTVKSIFCCGGKANDITALVEGKSDISDKLLRYSENHDERRIASPVAMGVQPEESGFGSSAAGIPVSALLYFLGDGPVMLYNGQEVGEPGSGAEGYGIGDGRTTIFDYWAMPELAKWVNGLKFDGGQLSDAQRVLRDDYRRLLALSTRDAIATGDFISLQDVNKDAATYCSTGRWCYTFIRHSGDEAYLIAVNMNPNNTYTLDLKVPGAILTELGFGDATTINLDDRMKPGSAPIPADVAKLTADGLKVKLDKAQVRVFSMSTAR